MKKLTPKQKKFIEYYAGNATDAARKAGYRGTDQSLSVQAHRLMLDPEIKKAIQSREQKSISLHIAKRENRQAWWTKVMEDVSEEMPFRLKASELLGRSEGDFLDRVEVDDKRGLAERLSEARKRKA